MSELREALAELFDGMDIARNGGGFNKAETGMLADAVLRVLAEHGDTQQVREQVERALQSNCPNSCHHCTERLQRVIAVVALIVAARDAAVDELQLEVRWRDRSIVRAERVEADLAAVRQQLDQVRTILSDLVDLKDGPRDAAYERRKPFAWEAARQILDAPARPAGHDETGQ